MSLLSHWDAWMTGKTFWNISKSLNMFNRSSNVSWHQMFRPFLWAVLSVIKNRCDEDMTTSEMIQNHCQCFISKTCGTERPAFDRSYIKLLSYISQIKLFGLSGQTITHERYIYFKIKSFNVFWCNTNWPHFTTANTQTCVL